MPYPIRAGDPPTPLPSEVLAGQNIAGFVLTPAHLDRLPTLTTYPPEPSGDEHAACRAIQAGEREAAETQADALRAEIARLTALLDDASAEADRADRAEAALAETRRSLFVHEGEGLLIPETFLPTPEHPAALRVDGPGLVEYDGRELRITYDARQATRMQTGEPLGEVVELYREQEECPNPSCAKLAHRGPCSEDLPDLADDPRRPRPDWYPDDGITLTYRELRQLLGLHLERCPADPDLARAMRDGESPLHLAEVLDR